MSLQNLPASLQNIIQLGYLEREFRDPLVSKLAYRSVVDKERFPAGIGETITKTKTGLFPAVTTPAATTANSDLDNGMTSEYWGVEQYVLTLNQYKASTDLNMMVAGVAIGDVFLQNVKKLAEQAARSVETLAQQALYNTFLGQNTRVKTTLGAPGVTVAVDDIRGFGLSWTTNNTPIAVSVSNPLSVTFIRAGTYSSAANSTNTTGGTYSLTGVTADGTNVSTALAVGGISGTLTFATNVAVLDGTLNNGVMAAVAPIIKRPFNRATSFQIGSGDYLTAQMILDAKSEMQANAVPPFANGNYRMIADPKMLNPLYLDPAFQRFQIGHTESSEYLKGTIGTIMGVEIVQSTMTPLQLGIGGGAAPAIHRGLLLGQGAMVEADWTETGYDNIRNTMDSELITVVDGIAHVTRPPLDRLGQIITQSWTYVGGFTSVTDIQTNSQTVPTSGNSAWKRAIMLETSVI